MKGYELWTGHRTEQSNIEQGGGIHREVSIDSKSRRSSAYYILGVV